MTAAQEWKWWDLFLEEDVCFNSPGLKIAQLLTDSGSFVSWSGQLYNSIAPPEPGQSWSVSQPKVQFSSSPVINVTPHPYFSFQGRKPFTLLFSSRRYRYFCILYFCPSSDDPWCPQLIILSPRPRTVSDWHNLWENADRDNETFCQRGFLYKSIDCWPWTAEITESDGNL